MKNAPTTYGNESAPDKRDYTAGKLPKRFNTLQANVLACLLDGKKLTGLESVFTNNTTRLAAVIHTLKRDYDWQFQKRDIAVRTNDGRNVSVTEYCLSDEIIKQAFSYGVQDWANCAMESAYQRRKKEAESKTKAKQLNDFRKPRDPRQFELWGA